MLKDAVLLKYSLVDYHDCVRKVSKKSCMCDETFWAQVFHETRAFYSAPCVFFQSARITLLHTLWVPFPVELEPTAHRGREHCSLATISTLQPSSHLRTWTSAGPACLYEPPVATPGIMDQVREVVMEEALPLGELWIFGFFLIKKEKEKCHFHIHGAPHVWKVTETFS